MQQYEMSMSHKNIVKALQPKGTNEDITIHEDSKNRNTEAIPLIRTQYKKARLAFTKIYGYKCSGTKFYLYQSNGNANVCKKIRLAHYPRHANDLEHVFALACVAV